MSYESSRRPPRKIPLPFLQQAVGLGDVVAGATQAVGVQPCGGCQQRKRWLNERFQLVPRRRRVP